MATSVAGAAVGISQDALAVSTGSTLSSSSWTALQGRRVGLLDASGTLQRVRVEWVRVAEAQAGTSGEAFTVCLTGATSRIPDGLYRLRGGVSGRVFLIEGKAGSAILTVNTLRMVS